MTLLQGIQLHELIMMILGFILGLALIFVFLFTSLKGKPNLRLLYGFVAPTVMIGYPSIKSVEFGNNVVKIDKLVDKVNANPTDTLAQRELVQTVQTLPASRILTSSDALVSVAKAQAALGQYDSAKVTIQKAVNMDNTSIKAIESQKDIMTKLEIQKKTEQNIQQIDNVVKKIQEHPNDLLLRDSLRRHLNKLETTASQPVHIDGQKLLVVAQAVDILGQPQEAIQLADEVSKANPKLSEATKMKEDFKSKESKRKTKYNSTLTKPQPNKTRPTNDAAKKVETVPAPAPVYQDTPRLSTRLIPKAMEIKGIWDKKD